MTNYEKIKNMSVSELADMLFNLDGNCGEICTGCNPCEFNRDCESRIIKWLESEVTNNA